MVADQGKKNLLGNFFGNTDFAGGKRVNYDS